MAHSATSTFRPGAWGSATGLRSQISRRWQALPPRWRSQRVLGALAFLLALLLLLAFHQVLAQTMHRAEARRAAWSNTAYAMTRCAALSRPELRDACRARALAGIVPPEPPLDNERVARLN